MRETKEKQQAKLRHADQVSGGHSDSPLYKLLGAQQAVNLDLRSSTSSKVTHLPCEVAKADLHKRTVKADLREGAQHPYRNLASAPSKASRFSAQPEKLGSQLHLESKACQALIPSP